MKKNIYILREIDRAKNTNTSNQWQQGNLTNEKSTTTKWRSSKIKNVKPEDFARLPRKKKSRKFVNVVVCSIFWTLEVRKTKSLYGTFDEQFACFFLLHFSIESFLCSVTFRCICIGGVLYIFVFILFCRRIIPRLYIRISSVIARYIGLVLLGHCSSPMRAPMSFTKSVFQQKSVHDGISLSLLLLLFFFFHYYRY